jgi:hypothetical protein
METDFKEIAKRLDATAELLRGSDRRWEISAKRAKAFAELIREPGHRVSDAAKFLRRITRISFQKPSITHPYAAAQISEPWQ